jgi:hypothetical protein
MDEYEIDGWIVIHTNPDDTTLAYGKGPLPTREMAEAVASVDDCTCIVSIVPVFFAPGTSMAIAIPADELMAKIEGASNVLRQMHNARLN